MPLIKFKCIWTGIQLRSCCPRAEYNSTWSVHNEIKKGSYRSKSPKMVQIESNTSTTNLSKFALFGILDCTNEQFRPLLEEIRLYRKRKRFPWLVNTSEFISGGHLFCFLSLCCQISQSIFGISRLGSGYGRIISIFRFDWKIRIDFWVMKSILPL